MIPRKRLHLLLCILQIFYVFGDGDPGTDDDTYFVMNFPDTSLVSETTSATDIHGWSIERNTISSDRWCAAKRRRVLYDSTDDEGQDIYVRNLTVVDSTPNSLTIQWDKIEGIREANFLIEWFADDSETPVNFTTINDQHEYDINNLYACTTYRIRVTPVTNEIPQTPKCTVGKTAFSAPTRIDELIAKPGPQYIFITWTPPRDIIRCLSDYIIEICEEGGSCRKPIKLSSEATNYNMTDLYPCMVYNVTIVASGGNQLSPPNTVNSRTLLLEDKIQEPQNLIAEPIDSEQLSLNVSWMKPKGGPVTCIKEYRVTVDAETSSGFHHKQTIYTNNTIAVFKDLRPCLVYSVYVFPINEKNGDGFNAFIRSKPTPGKVSSPPTWMNDSLILTRDSITLQWKIDNEKNDCKLRSIITECRYINIGGFGYDIVNGTSNVSLSIDGPNVVNASVAHLSPFTIYNCRALVSNDAGNSSWSADVKEITTEEDVPEEPKNFAVSSSDQSSVSFQWKNPEKIPGELRSFEIQLNWIPRYPVPDWCRVSMSQTIKDINPKENKFKYIKRAAYSNFTAMIKAKTGAGWGPYSLPIEFDTDQSVPDKVSNLTVEPVPSANDANVLSTFLSWGLPCSLNGVLSKFDVSFSGTREGSPEHSFTSEVLVDDFEKNKIFEIDLGELKAQYTYSFRVAARLRDEIGEAGEVAEISVDYPNGIPPLPDEEYVKSITLNPDKARRTTTSAAILLPLFPTDNGNIQYYAIMVSEKGYNNATFRRYDIKNGQWPNATSWEEAMESDFTIPYQATEPRWNPFPKHVIDYGHMKAVKYVVGEETTCKEVSMNTNTRIYCNGPLKPDKSYEVRMRAFTTGGYADSMPFYIKTNAELNVALVIGVVFGILFLGILTTLLLLVRRCSVRILFQRLLHADIPGSPVPAPFTRRKFISHCQQLADNPGKLSNEFQLLQTLSVDLQMPTNAACLQANRKKNRYSDILPYDFSRVKLDVIDNDPNSDYINASFIRGYTSEEEYIACQGPKEETTYDFWRMIDQYDVQMILMLTQLVEKGKDKCHQYFPTIRETFTYEKMSIRCTSELDYRTFTQRTLVLEKNEKKRNIIHLHFKDWPDHDVPDEFDAMINFCQLMRKQITALKGVVVIHCSAGIGRTGTLIAIDVLLQTIRDNRKLDVFGTVYRLRRHRLNMVQRESQYAYIYNCIRQVLKNPHFSKTYKPPPIDPLDAKNKKDRTDSTADSVSSIDTLRKSRLTGSADSMEPLYQSSPQSAPKLQSNALGLAVKGLRFCKSTSAIDTRSNHNRMVVGRAGSEGYTACESAIDSASTSMESIDDMTDQQVSKNSLSENAKLLRSKSSNVLEMREYEYLTNDPADKDTSL